MKNEVKLVHPIYYSPRKEDLLHLNSSCLSLSGVIFVLRSEPVSGSDSSPSEITEEIYRTQNKLIRKKFAKRRKRNITIVKSVCHFFVDVSNFMGDYEVFSIEALTNAIQVFDKECSSKFNGKYPNRSFIIHELFLSIGQTGEKLIKNKSCILGVSFIFSIKKSFAIKELKSFLESYFLDNVGNVRLCILELRQTKSIIFSGSDSTYSLSEGVKNIQDYWLTNENVGFSEVYPHPLVRLGHKKCPSQRYFLVYVQPYDIKGFRERSWNYFFTRLLEFDAWLGSFKADATSLPPDYEMYDLFFFIAWFFFLRKNFYDFS